MNNISIICSVQYSFPEIPISYIVNKNHLIFFCSGSIKKLMYVFKYYCIVYVLSLLEYKILLQIKDCLPSDGITLNNLTPTEVVFLNFSRYGSNTMIMPHCPSVFALYMKWCTLRQ